MLVESSTIRSPAELTGHTPISEGIDTAQVGSKCERRLSTSVCKMACRVLSVEVFMDHANNAVEKKKWSSRGFSLTLLLPHPPTSSQSAEIIVRLTTQGHLDGERDRETELEKTSDNEIYIETKVTRVLWVMILCKYQILKKSVQHVDGSTGRSQVEL